MPEGIDLPGDLIQVLKGKAMRSGAYSAEMFDELTTSIRDPSYEEGDDSSRLAEDKLFGKIHYKQVEGYSMLSDGLAPIAEEDTTDHSDGMTHEVISTARSDEELAASSHVGTPAVHAKENEGSFDYTAEESRAVEDATGTSVNDEQDDVIPTGKARAKSKCHHCHHISD